MLGNGDVIPSNQLFDVSSLLQKVEYDIPRSTTQTKPNTELKVFPVQYVHVLFCKSFGRGSFGAKIIIHAASGAGFWPFLLLCLIATYFVFKSVFWMYTIITAQYVNYHTRNSFFVIRLRCLIYFCYRLGSTFGVCFRCVWECCCSGIKTDSPHMGNKSCMMIPHTHTLLLLYKKDDYTSKK